MNRLSFKQASQRYRRIFVPVMLIYVLLCFIGPIALSQFEERQTWLYAAFAVFTAAPIGMVFWLKLRLAKETDEYNRLQQLSAMAEAGAVTVFACVVAGFLHLYEVLPAVWSFWAAPVYFLSYGLSVLRRQVAFPTV